MFCRLRLRLPSGVRTHLRRTGGLCLAVAASLGLLAASSGVAQAGLLIQYRVDGGPLAMLASGASDSVQIYGPLATPGNVFELSGSAMSNAPGTPQVAKLLSSTLSIANLTGATHTLELIVGVTGFTMPLPDPFVRVDSHIGGSVSTDGAANTMTFLSCVDNANGQNTCPGTASVGPTSPDITHSSFQGDKSARVYLLDAPYSITQDMMLTLSGHSEINTAANTVVHAVPEPAASGLLAIGLAALGALRYRRRRNRVPGG